MSALRPQQRLDGVVSPLIMNNCNYNKPAPGQPALITLREAEVIFHEFGHGLHGLLSNVTYPSIAGTSVDFDFVEFPAQIYEHWMRQPEVMQEFALHHETGEPMPTALLERLRAASNAKSGFDNVEFIASAFVDMAFHRITDPEALAKLDVNSFEDGVLAHARIPLAIEMRHRSPHFRHSFGGELYASGYYTYMWAGLRGSGGHLRPGTGRQAVPVRVLRRQQAPRYGGLRRLPRPRAEHGSAAAQPRSGRRAGREVGPVDPAIRSPERRHSQDGNGDGLGQLETAQLCRLPGRCIGRSGVVNALLGGSASCRPTSTCATRTEPRSK